MNNRTKKLLALVLALVFVVALFAGCGGNNSGNNGGSSANTGSGSASTGSGTTSDSGSTDTGSADEGPYHFAAGKYEMNDRGYPATQYEYTQPLCDTDETLTRWTTCYTPQYLPEDGFNAIPTWQQKEEMTGVHIEYNTVASSTRSQNFSVLVASDDLDDIMDQASAFYTGGTLKSAVEEGFFANAVDYLEYLPNYMWRVGVYSENDITIRAKLFYDEETIPSLLGMVHDPCPAEGYMLRQDWMDQLELGDAIDVTTYDELYKVLTAMKTLSTPDHEIFPLFINNIGEVYQSALVGGFDTTLYTSTMTYPRVVDGVVEFCGTTHDDFEMMTMMNKWYSEGLISPNFQTFVAGEDYDCGAYTDGLGCHLVVPSSWNQLEQQNTNPNTRWEPIHRTKKTEDQVFKYGYVMPRNLYSYGSACVSAKCENLPLAYSWIDWAFSEFGSEFQSFGAEGYMWEYNDAGERELTEWALTNEAGTSWLFCMYGTFFSDCALLHNWRDYYYPEGKRLMVAFEVFTVDDYKGEYDWPACVNFTDDERDETNSLFSDLNTYFSENYMSFLTGDKPLTEWDKYIQDLNDFGYARIREIYQDGYDRFTVEYADYL